MLALRVVVLYRYAEPLPQLELPRRLREPDERCAAQLPRWQLRLARRSRQGKRAELVQSHLHLEFSAFVSNKICDMKNYICPRIQASVAGAAKLKPGQN